MTLEIGFQIALDSLLLFICSLGMFRDTGRINTKDYLLYPLLVLLYGIARISAEIGMDRVSFSMQKSGYEFLPVNSIGMLIFLFLIVLIVNSLWFRHENGFTFFATLGVFAVIVIIREALIIFLYLFNISEAIWFLCICRVLSIGIALLFTHSFPFRWLKDRLREGDFSVRLLICNTVVILVMLIQLFSFDISKMLLQVQITAGVLGIVIVVDFVVILLQQRHLQERKRIDMLEQYLPVIEELIVEIKAKQHEYNNRLLSVSAIVNAASSLEQAKSEVEKMIQGEKINAAEHEIIKCDSKVFGGMLYSKVKQAQMKGLRVVTQINALFKNISVQEADLVEIIGILMDNAIEASSRLDTIYVRIGVDNGYLSILVSNPHEVFSNIQFVQMFRRGFTTKKNLTHSSGHGLPNICRIVEHYYGKIITKNETIEDINYATFGVFFHNSKE